jgi:biopolymer transport protein ExbD
VCSASDGTFARRFSTPKSVMYDRDRARSPIIALCGCTGSEPTRAPDIAAHEVTPRPKLDVPALASTTGTMDPVAGAAITLTGAPDEVAAQRAAIPERGPALVAIGRNVAFHAVVPSLDGLRRAGVSDLGLLVTVANERRMLVIEGRLPSSADPSASMAVVSAGAGLTFDGEPISLEALPAAISRAAPSRVVVVPDRDITMQRLAEVIAANCGRVFIGKATLPSVTRSDLTQ